MRESNAAFKIQNIKLNFATKSVDRQTLKLRNASKILQ